MYAGSEGEEIEAKGGRTGRGDAEGSFTLPFEFDEVGRSDSLGLSFDSGGVESWWLGRERRLEGAGAEKDCSKGFGSRSKSERPLGGGRRSAGTSSGLCSFVFGEWLVSLDMTLAEGYACDDGGVQATSSPLMGGVSICSSSDPTCYSTPDILCNSAK